MTGRTNQHFEQLRIDRHGFPCAIGPVPAIEYTPAVRALPSFLVRALEERGEGLNVAVIRLGALGDILRTLPPVRLLRRALPRARIVWVVDDRWSLPLHGHGDVDAVVEVPRGQWSRAGRGPSGWLEVLRSVRALGGELSKQKAALALDFHGNLRSGVVSRMTGAGVRLGYAGHQSKELNRWFTTHRVASGDRRTPRMERNLDLIRALGLPDGPLPDAGLPLVEAGSASAARIVAGPLADAPFALINPGASVAQAFKKPPAQLLAAACRALGRRGVAALVVWGPGEEDDARRVVEAAGGGATLAPATDLATLAALAARARLFVGGDSGPMHLACAVGCAVVALYGGTDPSVNAPWGVPCRAVAPAGRAYAGIKRLDRASGGFDGLEPERVESAVNELLQAVPAA